MCSELVLTGGTGWLGSCVLALINEERPRRRVHALALPGEGSMLAEAYTQIDLRVVEGDLSDESAIGRLFKGTSPGAGVLHAAGVIHPARVGDFHRVNVAGTQAIARAASQSGVRRLVHISSNSPFGLNASNSDVFRANEPYNPYLGYGKSKMAAELAVKAFARAGDFKLVILRPPWFYGPGQPERQAIFLSMVRHGTFPVPGSGLQRRSMVFVPDLARAALAAIDRDARPGAYWIADPEPYTLSEIVKLTKAALEAEGFSVKPGTRRVPAAVSTLARRVDALLQGRGLYSARVHVLGELGGNIACDVGPAAAALGWSPGPGLLEGMRVSIRDWLAQGGEIP